MTLKNHVKQRITNKLSFIEEDTIMAEATEQAPKAAPSKTKATAPKQAPKGKKGKKRR